MFCSKCGTKNSDGAKFCLNCGTPIVCYSSTIANYTDGAAAQIPIPPAPVSNTIPHSAGKPNKRKKVIIIVCTAVAFVLAASLFFLLVGKNGNVFVMADYSSYYCESEYAPGLWGNPDYCREEITAIVFGRTLDEAGAGSWDISEAHDGSILAWVSGTTLYIGADGTVSPAKSAAWLFEDFVNVTRIDFADAFDTSNVTDMSGMFSACSDLTSIDLSSFDTSNVTDMSFMFDCCYSLAPIDVSSFDTSNVTNMRGMFGFCGNLTHLDLSSFDTSSVIDMSYMFSTCDSLVSVDLSSFDTSNVTDMSGMFYSCSSLTSVDVSSFNTSNVTDMGYMFFECNSLTSPDINDFEIRPDCDTDYMFGNESDFEDDW